MDDRYQTTRFPTVIWDPTAPPPRSFRVVPSPHRPLGSQSRGLCQGLRASAAGGARVSGESATRSLRIIDTGAPPLPTRRRHRCATWLRRRDRSATSTPALRCSLLDAGTGRATREDSTQGKRHSIASPPYGKARSLRLTSTSI